MLIYSKAVAAVFSVFVAIWLAFTAAQGVYNLGYEAAYSIGKNDGFREGGKMGFELGVRAGQQMRRQPIPNNET